MIIRQTPKNKDNYIVVNNVALLCELANMGIIPKYMDGYNFYFVPTEELKKYLEAKEREQWMN